MKKAETSAVFFTGPAGNGKSTLITLMHEAMKTGPVCHRVRRMDMSRIITHWGMNQDSSLGRKLREYKPSISRGEYLPDALAIETFTTWLDVITRAHGPELFLLAGVPRTVPQLVLCDLFRTYGIIHIDATQDQSDTAIISRIDSGDIRLDSDTSEVFRRKRWDEYISKTRPILDRDPAIIRECRSTPLKVKLINILNRLGYMGEIEEYINNARIALGRIDHLVNQEIAKIEGRVLPQTQ